ncbi:RNA-splicing ligase RtcB [bacterium CG2_30_54_10]|nr:MAG: RNA-splicing ligase RtcB [bacterium CG2_30_54_10]
MEWIKDKKSISGEARVPVKSWCSDLEPGAMAQAANLAAHPSVIFHVALMPDCHIGYGMPIGGVIACKESVIPNAVGVDIGCGMGAIRTTATLSQLPGLAAIRKIMDEIKLRIPVGEGNSHKSRQQWNGFDKFEASLSGGEHPGWLDASGFGHDSKNLGTLGGGNHFIELQAGEDGAIWLMLHSGSRNLGYRVANLYHKLAGRLNDKWHVELPAADLAFMPTDSDEGQAYIRDMNFALAYALENRRRMMAIFKEVVAAHLPGVEFPQEINIHHNYAAVENHFGQNVWIHRKGATSAKSGELGIIPGSMGASSYIVSGRGNPESFNSCSHGAGRRMGRSEASRRLSLDEVNKAMEGIVFDRWSKVGRSRKGRDPQHCPGGRQKGAEFDLGEAPQAYKDIDQVIGNQLDLIEPLVKLRPLGVIKG